MVEASHTHEGELREVPRVEREVIIPVFVSVSLQAEDDMEAEAVAVDCIRGINDITVPGAKIAFRSVIGPSCKPL